MSGYMWKRDNDGNIHLEDDVLLAYTRGQLSADIVLMVQQHCAKCTVCTQKCAEYTQIGMTLQQNLTYVMPIYPSIVDMLGKALDNPAAASAALRERRENKKLIRRKSARTPGSRAVRPAPRVGVLPLIISVSLVMLMVLLAYTLSSYMGSRASPGHPAPPIMSTLPVQPTATRTPTPTKTVNASTPVTMVGATVTATPGGTGMSVGTTKPVIWICSSNTDLAQSRLRICGKNFKAGDRVIVLEVLPGISHKVGTVTSADVHGNINGVWTIPNCRYVPIAVFAFDLTHATFTLPVPVNISIGGCRSPNVKIWGH